MNRTGRIILGLVCAALLAGCAPAASSGDFDSDNPDAKLFATRRAGDTKDRKKIPELVAQLDSEDPVTRMMSIKALEEITGERLGYNPYDDALTRRPAVAAWNQAVQDHRFDTVSH